MKKIWQILLIVLLVAAIAGAALAWRYRDYLRAFSDAKQYSSEDLQEQMDENRAALDEIVSQYLPQEQSAEDPPQNSPAPIDGPPQSEIVQPVTTSDEPSIKQETPKEAEKVDPEVAGIIAEFDALRSDYLARLEAMKSRAYSEYKQREFSKKELLDFAAGFVQEATALEVECDNKVIALLSQLQKVIENNGGDTMLPDQIFELYLNEKQLTKAKYISELEKRGLIL